MKLTPQMKKLHAAMRTLSEEQGRIARRNARRRVLGAMKALRNALDKEFPPIEKIKVVVKDKPPPKKAKKRAKLKLKGRRPWRLEYWRLFVRVTAATFGIREVYPDYQYSYNWPDARKWGHLINQLANEVERSFSGLSLGDRAQQVLRLWNDFWTGPLPLGDIVLASEHQDFLEKVRKK